MTRKDYEKVAAVLNRNRPDPLNGRERMQWERIRASLSFMFREDNPRYRPDLFYRATEGEPAYAPAKPTCVGMGYNEDDASVQHEGVYE